MPASATGGVPPLNVSIRITTTGAASAARAMGAVTRAAGGMSRGVGTGVVTARTLGDAMRMSATLMKYTVAGAFMKVGSAAVQAARNFELSFSRIRGLTGMAADAVEDMKQGVLEMATETTRGPEELAEALYFITSSGLRNSVVAMDVLKNAAKASAAGLGDTKTVVDAVTSAMNAYGPANLSAARATDILVATVREGKAEADTFAPAFSKVLPVAAAFGASFEDVAAAMAALTRSGMSAGTSGIYVRQVLSQLLKPSKQAQEALAAVGLSAEGIRTSIQEQGLFPALQQLSARLGGTDKAAMKFAKVFGNVRALTAVLQLVGPAAEENSVIFERLQNSTGDLSDAFGAYEETVDAKFNRALAASRTALIEIGDALKPVISTLLFASEKFAMVAKIFVDNPIGRGFSTIVAGATLAVVAIAATMKTTSALIRLLANLTVTLTGNQLMYNANEKALYRLVTAKTAVAASTKTMTVGTATYAKMTFTATGAIKGMGKALWSLAKNPYFLAISAIIAITTTAFMFFKKSQKEAEKARNAIVKITDVLDEAVKYGKTTFKLDVEANVESQSTKEAVKRIEEQIEEMSPGFVEKVNNIFDTAGQEAGLEFLQALLTSVFGGMTGDTKDKLAAYFRSEFGLSEEDWAKSLGVEKITGDRVTDAFIQAASISAAGTSASFTKALEGKGGINFSNIVSELQNRIDPITLDFQADPEASRVVGEIANFLGDNIQATEGALQPTLVMLGKLDDAGVLYANTLSDLMGPALHKLNGDLNISKEEAGDFYRIFKHKDNQSALTQMIRQTTGLGSAAGSLKFHKIRDEILKLPYSADRGVKAFQILRRELAEYTDVSSGVPGVNQQVAESFESLQREIKDSIELYTEQKSVIKKLEEAQRGLLGINLDQEEALRDVYDAFNDVRDSVKDGGGFNILSEAGRKNREELQKAALAAANYANALFAETGDPTQAGLRFQEGIQGIIRAAGSEGASAQALLEEMGFTPDWFAKSLIAGQEEVSTEAVNTGKAVMDGVKMGVDANAAGVSATVVAALRRVIIDSEKALGISSPSKVTAKAIGLPMAQGVGAGFRKELKNQSGGMAKDLNTAVSKLYTGKYDQKKAQAFFKNFLKSKKAVETPAQDFVKETIGRMKDIIGSLGNYIKSQLSFRDAQANLAKLINMQRKYDDDRKKSAREVQYSQTRFGGMGGAQVTGYEQAQIDQLQLEFERVSRDYAMGRASYVDLVDAEIALFEARAAAAEVNDDVISAQNDFIDSTVKVENKSLELASLTVDVLSAYQDVQEASYELYINHKELAGVYDSLAKATGIASGKIVIGSRDIETLGADVGKLGGYASTVGGYVSSLGNSVDTTGLKFDNKFFGEAGIFKTLEKTATNADTMTKQIGASFTDMSRGLLDTDSDMYKNLKSLGPAIFNAIQTAANEQFATSPLQLHIPVDVTTTVTGGKGSNTTPDDDPFQKLSYEQWKLGAQASIASGLISAYRVSLQGQQHRGVNVGEMVTAYSQSASFKNALSSALFNAYQKYLAARAVGGPVAGMNAYMVGERGPEMFVPKVSGTIVTTSALERYTRTRESGAGNTAASASNNISVTVNNPVPAAAEDSITRRMKVLSNSGLFG